MTIPFVVTVQGQTHQPYADLSVYAFDGDTYTGYNGTTDASGHVTFTLPQGSYHFRADFDNVQFWSNTQNDCTLPGCTSASVTLPGGMGETTTTINYTYDPLYRLTAADYSNGDSYRYAYDAVGNRLQQETSVNGQQSTAAYQYDIANRLTNVDNVNYAWDANGNLLNDGASTYTYDPANRLTGLTQGSNTYTYAYNGLGDRLQQTVNGQTTNYTLDLNAGLTQVLEDGTNTYTYGVDRISQQHGTTAEYFLGDALGSVRQLTDASDAVTLSKSYDPYGNVISSAGSSTSVFGYAGEQGDQSGLTYLRARYYDPVDGRFTQLDPMQDGNNWYMYTQDNPINYTDQSGYSCLGVGCSSIIQTSSVSASNSLMVSLLPIMESGCLNLGIPFFDPPSVGYVEGVSFSAGVGSGDISGTEVVYDFATMTRNRFTYEGNHDVGGGIGGILASVGISAYAGEILGFRSNPDYQGQNPFPQINYDYAGPFEGFYVSAGPLGVGFFHDMSWNIRGGYYFNSIGWGLLPGEIVGFRTIYSPVSNFAYSYADRQGKVNKGKLIHDIMTGNWSPIPFGVIPTILVSSLMSAREAQVSIASLAVTKYEFYWKLSHPNDKY